MKLYTFLDDAGEIISQVRAANHDDAVKKCNTATFSTDFYSEQIDDDQSVNDDPAKTEA